MHASEKYALVLGGGGAHGAYEIGAWKALRKIGIKFIAVIGNSVGAFNGALIIQNDYKKALEFWKTITLDKIINIPPELLKDGSLHLDIKSIKHVNKINDMLFKNMGLDTSPMKKMVYKYINEKKIRKSKIDFGLVTYQIDSLKPLEIFKKEMASGSLADYLLASASLPGFKPARINGKAYADGGIYDNLPYKAVKDRGYKNIILVDISGPGVNRKPDIIGTKTVYLKNSIELGNIFDLNPENIKRNFNLGYYDTLKTFGKISGIKYFYKENKRIITKMEKILFSEEVFNEYRPYLNKKTKYSIESIGNEIKMLLPAENRNYLNLIIPLAESAALSLNLERNYLYKFNGFLKTIFSKYKEIENTNYNPFVNKNVFEFFKEKIRNKDFNLVKFIKKFISESSFVYDKMFESIFGMDKLNLHEKLLDSFFPNLIPAKIFFIVLKHYFKE